MLRPGAVHGDVPVLEDHRPAHVEQRAQLPQRGGVALLPGLDLDGGNAVIGLYDEVYLDHAGVPPPAEVARDGPALHEAFGHRVLGDRAEVPAVVPRQEGLSVFCAVHVHEQPRVREVDLEGAADLVGPQGRLRPAQLVAEVPVARLPDPEEIAHVAVRRLAARAPRHAGVHELLVALGELAGDGGEAFRRPHYVLPGVVPVDVAQAGGEDVLLHGLGGEKVLRVQVFLHRRRHPPEHHVAAEQPGYPAQHEGVDSPPLRYAGPQPGHGLRAHPERPEELFEVEAVHGYHVLVAHRYERVGESPPAIPLDAQEGAGRDHVVSPVGRELLQRAVRFRAFLYLVEEEQRLSGDDGPAEVDAYAIDDGVDVEGAEDPREGFVRREVQFDVVPILPPGELLDDE